MARRHISNQGMVLDPAVLHSELASPRRRFAAFALDMAVLVLPSLVLALLVAWAALAIREPVALAALSDMLAGEARTEEAVEERMRDLVPLLVEYDMPGTPAAAVAAYEAGDLDGAVEALEGRNLMIVLNVEEAPAVEGQVRIELGRLIPFLLRLVAFYGLAALYFTWWMSRRSGATLGKRWLGVRVVKIDGSDPTLLESFERFVGFFQIPASFGTALLDLWRDPNRRLPHDRLSGTVVLRTRRG